MTADSDIDLPDGPCVCLALESRPETLTLVRATLSGLAELLQLDPELLDDLKTAISEACNNVVLHAYPGEETGPLSVEIYVLREALAARIRDRGVGIEDQDLLDDTHMGVGIPVMRALAERAEFYRPDSGGTEVVLRFSGVRDGELLYDPPRDATPDDGWSRRLSGDAVASISPVTMVGTVLGRIARTLAASARFSLDRFSDVYLVTDALAAVAASEGVDDRVNVSLRTGSRRLELSVGPLQPGSVDRIQRDAALPAGPSPLTALSDELEGDQQPGDGEVLRLVMLDRR
jgi:serine/threonine-protein kinase RsbW